jgi:hypothetical protein
LEGLGLLGQRDFAGKEPHDGALDLGSGVERTWPQAANRLDLEACSREYRQRSVLLGCRLGDQTVSHLSLHHQYRASQDGAMRDDPSKDGTGRLIGKVSSNDELRPTITRMYAEIDLCSIRMTQRQSLLPSEFLTQHAHHVSVELNREDLAVTLEQRVRQRTETRAELDDLPTQRRRGIRDLCGGTGLYQEILGKGSLGKQVVFP